MLFVVEMFRFITEKSFAMCLFSERDKALQAGGADIFAVSGVQLCLFCIVLMVALLIPDSAFAAVADAAVSPSAVTVNPAGELKGIGHFSIGFMLGYALFLLLKGRKATLDVSLYGPFLPFLLGLLAAIPYLLQVSGVIDATTASSPVFNVFVLYGVLEQIELLGNVLGNFYVPLAINISLYLLILRHYIHLVRAVRSSHAE